MKKKTKNTIKKVGKVCILCLFVGLMVVSLFGCSSKKENFETTTADMSGYSELSTSERHHFKEITPETLLSILNKSIEDVNGIFLIGFDDCTGCQDAVPILEEVANEKSISIYYCDAVKLVKDSTSYAQVMAVLSNYTNSSVIQTPLVLDVENNEIIDFELGAGDDFKTRIESMVD